MHALAPRWCAIANEHSVVDGSARLKSTAAKPTSGRGCACSGVHAHRPLLALLEGNFCACFFELFLDRLGFFFRDAFFDDLRSAFDQILCLFEA